nr:TonB-dependent receptor [uncultured Bacteroides sp.]
MGKRFSLKFNVCFTLFLLLGVLIANADTGFGKIKGFVKNTKNKPLQNVNVAIQGTSVNAISNNSGEFTLDNVQSGSNTLVVTMIGYGTQKKQITISSGEITECSFMLDDNTYNLNEVTITSSKQIYNPKEISSSLRLGTPILNIPQNVQVIDQSLLADQQVNSMLEGVSRNVSGVRRMEHWDTYALLYMRGSQVAAFRNGMNVQMPWGPLAEDMSMVDRIEFVKGPAGFMLASGEPSGFYNIVTKKPTGNTKGSTSTSLGSNDLYRAALDVDGILTKDKKLLVRLNMMGQSAGSHRPYEWSKKYIIAPVLSYNFDDKTSLTAEYTYQHQQMSVVGSSYVFGLNGYGELPYDFTTVEPNLDPTSINDHSLFLTLNHQFNKDWKFTGQLAYLNFNQKGSSLWPTSLDLDGTLHRRLTIWDAFNEAKLGQFFVNGKVTTGGINHRILAGLDMGSKNYIADWGQAFDLEGSVPFNIYNLQHGTLTASTLPKFDRSLSLRARAGNNIVNQNYTALYVQDELGFFNDILRVTLAGRVTRNKTSSYGSNTDDTKFTPRVGVSAAVDKSTSVYGLYDQAFVPQTGTDYTGKAFDPITGNNLEFGIKKNWFDGYWNSTVSVYRITKNNVLTTDENHPQYSVQLGQSRTQGVEFDLKGRLFKGMNVIFNYAYTDSKVTKDADINKVGQSMAGTTKHITNGWVNYTIQEGALANLGFSLGYQWQLDRSAWYVFSGTNSELPDYFRMDGAVSWKKDKISLSLNVNNLLNDYLYSGSPYGNFYYWQTEPLRNFRLNLTYNF